MKFRWKLMIITMLIVSFGFGGMLLIQYSYQASQTRKKSSKEFLRNDLKNVKRN